jgi:hypothetical protein
MSDNFSSSRRLKINHITVAKYAFILEQGAFANTKNIGTFLWGLIPNSAGRTFLEYDTVCTGQGQAKVIHYINPYKGFLNFNLVRTRRVTPCGACSIKFSHMILELAEFKH